MREQRGPAEELVAAAEAFASELQTFGKLAQAAEELKLTSQKGLQRAARLFREVGESEVRLGAAAQALLGAIGAAHQRQHAEAQRIQARGDEIRQRTEQATALLQRFGAVGEDAANLNAMAHEVLKGHAEGAGARDPGLRAALLALHDRLSELVGAAQAIGEDARGIGFEDIAREAETLRQQLRAARDRVAQLAPVERQVGQA